MRRPPTGPASPKNDAPPHPVRQQEQEQADGDQGNPAPRLGHQIVARVIRRLARAPEIAFTLGAAEGTDADDQDHKHDRDKQER
jgi:hypothetical protein